MLSSAGRKEEKHPEYSTVMATHDRMDDTEVANGVHTHKYNGMLRDFSERS
jgi:hypothetical protein